VSLRDDGERDVAWMIGRQQAIRLQQLGDDALSFSTSASGSQVQWTL